MSDKNDFKNKDNNLRKEVNVPTFKSGNKKDEKERRKGLLARLFGKGEGVQSGAGAAGRGAAEAGELGRGAAGAGRLGSAGRSLGRGARGFKSILGVRGGAAGMAGAAGRGGLAAWFSGTRGVLALAVAGVIIAGSIALYNAVTGDGNRDDYGFSESSSGYSPSLGRSNKGGKSSLDLLAKIDLGSKPEESTGVGNDKIVEREETATEEEVNIPDEAIDNEGAEKPFEIPKLKGGIPLSNIGSDSFQTQGFGSPGGSGNVAATPTPTNLYGGDVLGSFKKPNFRAGALRAMRRDGSGNVDQGEMARIGNVGTSYLQAKAIKTGLKDAELLKESEGRSTADFVWEGGKVDGEDLDPQPPGTTPGGGGNSTPDPDGGDTPKPPDGGDTPNPKPPTTTTPPPDDCTGQLCTACAGDGCIPSAGETGQETSEPWLSLVMTMTAMIVIVGVLCKFIAKLVAASVGTFGFSLGLAKALTAIAIALIASIAAMAVMLQTQHHQTALALAGAAVCAALVKAVMAAWAMQGYMAWILIGAAILPIASMLGNQGDSTTRAVEDDATRIGVTDTTTTTATGNDRWQHPKPR
jgi:hypothetical protein